MANEKRRHDRFYVTLPMRLQSGGAWVEAETVDVSLGGLFIRTPRPPPLRQLVKAVVVLPPDQNECTLMAMAVFVGPAHNAWTGVGLQLFGLDPSTRSRWEVGVRHVQTLPNVRTVPDVDAREAPVETSEPWERLVPELRVRLQNVSDLENILSRELPKGRMYVRTSVHLDSGTEVELQLMHPHSESTFSLAGRVDTRVQRTQFDGLRILLAPLDEARKSALSSFVRNARVTIDIDSDAFATSFGVESRD